MNKDSERRAVNGDRDGRHGKDDPAWLKSHVPVQRGPDAFIRDAANAILHTAELAFLIPERPASRWHRAGISPRGEKIFDVTGVAVLLLFAAAWTWSVAHTGMRNVEGAGVSTVTSGIAAALSYADAPTAPFVTEAVINLFAPLKGASGKLRARITPAGEQILADPLPAGTSVRFSSPASAESAAAAIAPRRSGIWSLALMVGAAIRPVDEFSLITLTPFSEKRRGKIGKYNIGSWPHERGGKPRSPKFAPPAGFIEVTRANQDTYVSEHFRLRDFLTHDQVAVWPKYLVLDTRLIDKMELVLSDLAERGITTKGVRVMSGFRTPQYNTGGGDARGRSSLSRHMYGDASDIFIDNNGDGNMDDLNGDGRVNIRDARVIEAAVDRVERTHPALVGGCGVYTGNSAHGPFVHIDTRGYRARWLGTGDS
ncbi:MAG: DUF882 domain-containing protein [Anaerolineae bacterium]|nr:DUF882 domain-containing protein [Gemmatimonadaceae bacterium]